ncbi:hypothetical protein EV421DRAFT_1969958 [Armillaria borealis]|uniref:Uncharacterized protein n=1 Tax=Armillaria borealis TaxID=47425 RepID=A0AA39JBH9_9AGAR|nr:hypothetical protein EV421DRAFT_1969958 [Armillaria borealis]
MEIFNEETVDGGEAAVSVVRDSVKAPGMDGQYDGSLLQQGAGHRGSDHDGPRSGPLVNLITDFMLNEAGDQRITVINFNFVFVTSNFEICDRSHRRHPIMNIYHSSTSGKLSNLRTDGNLPWAIATSRDCFTHSKKRANTCSTQTSPLVPDNSKDFCQYILEQASKKAASSEAPSQWLSLRSQNKHVSSRVFRPEFAYNSFPAPDLVLGLNSDLGGDVDKAWYIPSLSWIKNSASFTQSWVGEPEEQQETRKNPLSLGQVPLRGQPEEGKERQNLNRATPSLSHPTHRHPTAAQVLGNLLFCHFESGGVNILLHRLPMQIEAIWGWRRKFSSRLRERSTILGAMDGPSRDLMTKLTASKSRGKFVYRHIRQPLLPTSHPTTAEELGNLLFCQFDWWRRVGHSGMEESDESPLGHGKGHRLTGSFFATRRSVYTVQLS